MRSYFERLEWGLDEAGDSEAFGEAEVQLAELVEGSFVERGVVAASVSYGAGLMQGLGAALGEGLSAIGDNGYAAGYDSARNRFVIVATSASPIAFRVKLTGASGAAAFAGQVLGLTPDLDYYAIPVDGVLTVTGGSQPSIVYAPRVGLAREDVGREAITIRTTSWEGTLVTDGVPALQRSVRLGFEPLTRTQVYAMLAVTAGGDDVRNESWESFWQVVRPGLRVAYRDARRLVRDDATVQAGSTSATTLLDLVETPRGGRYAGAEMVVTRGAGFGQRRRIATNDGNTFLLETPWATGATPLEGSKVAIVSPTLTGVLSGESARGLGVTRLDTRAELYGLNVELRLDG